MVVNEGLIDDEGAKGVASTGEPAPSPKVSNGPRGIGGWLILPAIGIVLWPVVSAAGIAEIVEVLGQLPSGTLLYGFLWVELIANLAVAAFAVKVAFDFFRLKRQAPANYIALIVVGSVVIAVDIIVAIELFGAEFDRDDARTVGRAIVSAAIWIPYFKRSKRVANTFVR